jgi:transposase
LLIFALGIMINFAARSAVFTSWFTERWVSVALVSLVVLVIAVQVGALRSQTSWGGLEQDQAALVWRRWLWIEQCQRGDRPIAKVAKGFDLTETALREWVRQAERDAGTRDDGGLSSDERAELRRENRRLREDVEILQRGHGFLRVSMS